MLPLKNMSLEAKMFLVLKLIILILINASPYHPIPEGWIEVRLHLFPQKTMLGRVGLEKLVMDKRSEIKST